LRIALLTNLASNKEKKKRERSKEKEKKRTEFF
jgi:hypothetical protein